ncbi:negative regulator of PDR1-mediated fluconazole resistance JJJ1-like [Helianthus annuus]|uniref:negative regulator of PDR1-mediated fluconazole resistance JJJ1-like n=1 Tax=Helianthus annuus TaxID=4232 RepID=UPI000B8FB069|nr:negative regulator of PDR1-mediated fluconazole resistance JJJ1-like [Helianthus annuus]
MLVDEPEEDETEANVEGNQEQLSPETERLLKSIDYNVEAGEAVGEKVVDDKEKSSSDPEESDIDVETDQWIKANFDLRDRLIKRKRKRSADDDKDETYDPTTEDVQVEKRPPSRGRKKSTSRKPTSQTPVQTTPGSSGFKEFPHVPKNIGLEQIDDFSFVNDELVKKLQKKVEEVLVEKKKLEKRVKTVEAENSSLLKRVEADQADIDILKVRIAELEEEKARRDEQNEYFKLKNKELEANNAKKEHEMYMMNKVLENLIGKPVEQRFEEIELEEVRARRKAEIEAEMKNKGKDVQIEGVAEVTERAIVVSEPEKVPETSILDPCPISSVSDDVYSANSDHDDDGNDDDDQGSAGIKVTEVSHEEKIDEYLNDDANEESENASGEGEHDDTKNVDESDDHVT